MRIPCPEAGEVVALAGALTLQAQQPGRHTHPAEVFAFVLEGGLSFPVFARTIPTTAEVLIASVRVCL